MEAVIIHPGAHKTGTSLIQKYMRDRSELVDRARIFALDRGDGDKLIGWGEKIRLEENVLRLRSDIESYDSKGYRHYVISHENTLGRPLKKDAGHLYPDAAEMAGPLREALSGRQVKVVYYIRRQSAFFESYYLQTIHEGRHHNFAAFSRKFDITKLSWKPLIDGLREVFGQENVVVRSFDRDIRAGQSAFLQGFFESFTTVDPDHFRGFEYGPMRNPSIGDRGLELALKINPHLVTSEERKLFRKFFQSWFSNTTYPRPKLLTDEQKQEMDALYEAENQGLLTA